MAQESADLRQGERERIARRIAGAHVSGLRRLRRRDAGRRPRAGSRSRIGKRAHQRLDACAPAFGALEVDDESLGALNAGRSRKDLIMRPANRASGVLPREPARDVIPHRVIPHASSRPGTTSPPARHVREPAKSRPPADFRDGHLQERGSLHRQVPREPRGRRRDRRRRFRLDRPHARHRRRIRPRRPADPAHPSGLARLCAAEAVRARLGARARGCSASTRTSGSTTRSRPTCRASSRRTSRSPAGGCAAP